MNVIEWDNKLRESGGLERLVSRLVDEGMRVRKCPWSCDMNAEDLAYARLRKYGIRGQETMEETCARRETEKCA